MAGFTATMMAVAATAAAVGTGVSAYGAYSAGQAQKQASEINARNAEQQAIAIRQSADLDIQKQQKDQRRFVAQQRSLVAKSGVAFSGSPLDVIADSLADSELDMAITDYNARVGISQARSQSAYNTFMGNQFAKTGTLQAGSTLLSGWGQTGMMIASNVNTPKPTGK